MIRIACRVLAVLILLAGLLAAGAGIVTAMSNNLLGVSVASVLPSALMLALMSAAVAGVLWMLTSIDARLETLGRGKA